MQNTALKMSNHIQDWRKYIIIDTVCSSLEKEAICLNTQETVHVDEG